MSDQSDKLAWEMAEDVANRIRELLNAGAGLKGGYPEVVYQVLRPNIAALVESQCRDEEEHEILKAQLADSERESKIHVWEQLASKYLGRAEEAEAKLAKAQEDHVAQMGFRVALAQDQSDIIADLRAKLAKMEADHKAWEGEKSEKSGDRQE